MRRILTTLFILVTIAAVAQVKKPLDHSVYDSWQSIGEKTISNDGQWVAYVVAVQEGDAVLHIRAANGSYSKTIDRGYNVYISEDSRFLICKIKPTYAETREAKIKKKKPAESPKDSLAVLELGTETIFKVARVKSYQAPEKNTKWVAWQLEAPVKDSSADAKKDSVTVDPDVIKATNTPGTPEQEKKRKKISNPPAIKADDQLSVVQNEYPADAEDDPAAGGDNTTGTDLVIHNLHQQSSTTVPHVKSYQWSKTGNILLIESAPPAKQKQPKAISIFRSVEERFDTIMKGGNDFKNFAISEEGNRIAFVAERDSTAKAIRKFYKLWYWQNGQDTAIMLADKNSAGIPLGWTISEHAVNRFSKSGNRLFFGTAPLPPLKDTTLVDIDLVKVDIWHYKDDYLQTIQLKRKDAELKRSYLALAHIANKHIVQLGDKEVPDVMTNEDGDGELIIGQSDMNNRIAMQWEGKTPKDVYLIHPETGERKLIKKDLSGRVSLSTGGRFVVWYDNTKRNYFSWQNGEEKNITAKIQQKLYSEEFDMPDDPPPYGIMGWSNGDLATYIYDRYDIWQVDPMNVMAPINITKGEGRKHKTSYHYIKTNFEEPALAPSQTLLLRTFRETDKQSGLATLKLVTDSKPETIMQGDYHLAPNLSKARNADVYIYTRETYTQSPDLYVNQQWQKETRLSRLNPQQQQYNWGTAELFKWTAYNGKQAIGIVYKPEDFDPKKKYPTICYFYEKHSDGLHTYIPPAPTASRLNISFFVSRGYIVFSPDIEYIEGHPGKSAYNYILSGARALVKKGWADSTRMGLQGQSWGGYQTAQLITQTKLFKAAWAGAPVANMTSAYGGIRWESGMNRQFQYEKTQSRIGATLWEKPELYIENSPLFHLPKVSTPLVIMHNDNDGAVPWYQGIELFTGLRRLGKPVWMLNYNGEAHNLVERKNRKDIQVREQQFFDWLLKDEKPAQWLREGVPAVMKGLNWGLED